MKLLCHRNKIEIVPENQIEEAYLEHLIKANNEDHENVIQLRIQKNEWPQDQVYSNADFFLTSDKTF